MKRSITESPLYVLGPLQIKENFCLLAELLLLCWIAVFLVLDFLIVIRLLVFWDTYLSVFCESLNIFECPPITSAQKVLLATLKVLLHQQYRKLCTCLQSQPLHKLKFLTC